MRNLKIFRAFIGGILSTNLLWGSFYLGFEGGYLRNRSVYIYEDNSNATTGKNPNYTQHIIGNGGIINLVFGTEHFFAKNYVGIRWGIFGGYGYSQEKGNVGEYRDININLNILSLGANFDTIFNFYAKNDFMTGMFIGAEYDFTLLRPSSAIQIGERATNPVPKEDMLVGNKTYSNNVAIRVGLSTLVAKHHRIELIAKIPVWVQEHSEHFVNLSNLNNGTKDDRKYTFKYEYIQALVGYKYVF